MFQGAAISSECFSRYILPGNVAELRASPPLRESLEQLVRPSAADPPLQGTELAALSTPEASLERLVPLVDCAWKLLPNVSRWVLQTVEKGYYIQFCAPPAHFKCFFSHSWAWVWFSDLISLLDGSTWEIPVRRDLLSQAEGMISTHFLHGVMRLRPQVRSRVPPWDLAVVLEALCRTPFEPIEEISALLLTLKTVSHSNVFSKES